MNILITGSNGQLGSEFRQLESKYKEHKFFFTDVDDLDITDADASAKFVKNNGIQVCVNCAGYTAVDKAENDKIQAMLVNATAVKNLAIACAKANALFVHISTDYVFEGKNYKPYTENDTASPKSIYGKTKLDGEIEVIFNAKRALIFRTSWLYSSFGNNFVKTMVEKGKSLGELRVVYDQIGSPTYAADLAQAILSIMEKVPSKMRTEIYNFSNEGIASWYDFAKAIFDIKNIDCNVVPVPSKEYKTDAVRPFYSILDKSKIKKDFGLTIPYWRDSLKRCLDLM
ncbi:MAG: dTDP-4-dehydrorhamnose reductase [Bacteroidales bacterium]